MDGAVTIYELCDEQGGVHYVGKTRHPDQRRRQHEKAWPQWRMRVVSQVDADQAKDVETRLIAAREAAGHVLENVEGTKRARAIPVRTPENTFLRWAAGMLRNFYHIPPDQMAIRQSPLAKKRTIYVMVNGTERAIRNDEDLHGVVKELEAMRREQQEGPA